MKICIFSGKMSQHRAYYAPPPVLLIRLFVSMGFEVIVLTSSLPNLTGEDCKVAQDGADVYYLGNTEPGVTDEKFWKKSTKKFDELHTSIAFDLIVGRGRATWGYFKNSKFSGEIPVICHEGTYPRWVHQLEYRFPSLAKILSAPVAFTWSLLNFRYRYCLLNSDRVVCNSPNLAKALIKINPRRPPKTEYIPYGFDLSRFDVISSPSVPPKLVFVGRLAWDKGVLAMVEILARLENKSVILEIIGPSSENVRDAMLKLAREKGVDNRLLLTGPEHNANLPLRLTHASVFIFPSTHPEGLSKSVMEAMSAALPVVAYDIPGMDTLIKNGTTGWLVPARDTAAAASKVDALLRDPGEAKRMGLAGKKYIGTAFQPQMVTAQWKKLIDHVLESEPA